MGTGFFAGLLGGIGQNLHMQDERRYQQQQVDRALRIKGLQDQATAIDQRIQRAQDVIKMLGPDDPRVKVVQGQIDADMAMSKSIWGQVDEITGDASGKKAGGKNDGMSIGKLGSLLQGFHILSRHHQDPSGGPFVPGGPGASTSDPFGTPKAADAGAGAAATPPIPALASAQTGAGQGPTGFPTLERREPADVPAASGGAPAAPAFPSPGSPGIDKRALSATAGTQPTPVAQPTAQPPATPPPSGEVTAVPVPRTFAGEMGYISQISPDQLQNISAEATRRQKTADDAALFEEKLRQGKALGLSGDSLANYAAGRNIEPSVHLQHPMATLRDGRTIAVNFNPATGAYTAPSLGGKDVTDDVIAVRGGEQGGIIGLMQSAQAGDPMAAKTLKMYEDFQEKLGTMRGIQYELYRPVQAIDAQGNLQWTWAKNAVAGGLAPAAPGASAMSKQAQFQDIKSASQYLRDSVNKLEQPFSAAQIAKLDLAMRENDHDVFATEMNTILGSQNLTDDQKELVVWLGQINERALSLRNIAGMGQGSDQLRAAIRATLPSIQSGSKDMMLRQLAAFDNQVSLLEQGIPRIGGAKATPAIPTPKSVQTQNPPPPPPPPPSSKTVRMKTPDGKLWDIPQDNVEAAKKRGAVVVQ